MWHIIKRRWNTHTCNAFADLFFWLFLPCRAIHCAHWAAKLVSIHACFVGFSFFCFVSRLKVEKASRRWGATDKVCTINKIFQSAFVIRVVCVMLLFDVTHSFKRTAPIEMSLPHFLQLKWTVNCNNRSLRLTAGLDGVFFFFSVHIEFCSQRDN